jgi:hypothetical protein
MKFSVNRYKIQIRDFSVTYSYYLKSYNIFLKNVNISYFLIFKF